MGPDRFATRIESLDPESRAIVELSVGRGFTDEDLAGMLGTSVERVGERREAALGRLGVSTARDREAVAAALRGDGDGVAAGAAATAPAATEPAPAASDAGRPSAARSERPPRRRALAVAIVGGLLVATAVGVTLSLADGDAEPEPASDQASERESARGGGEPAPDEANGRSTPAQDPPAEESPPQDAEPEGAAVRLEPPAGGAASGTVELLPAEGDEGRRLLLTVRGLGPRRRAGGYGVWLYDSVSRARMVAGSRRGTFRAQIRLPQAAGRYRFLDVSYEPADDNPSHSGASLLRAPLGEVLGD